MNRSLGRCLRPQPTWLIAAVLALSSAAHAQVAPPRGEPTVARLQQAGLLDDYYPDAVREVAESLVRAAPAEWQGVRVNESHRPGWLNVYLVDAERLSEEEPFDAGAST